MHGINIHLLNIVMFTPNIRVLDQYWHSPFVSFAVRIFADSAAQELRELPMAREAAADQHRAPAGGGRKEAHHEGLGPSGPQWMDTFCDG